MPSPENPGDVPLLHMGHKRQTVGPLPHDDFVPGKEQAGWTRGSWCEANMSQRCIIFSTQEPGAGKVGSTQERGNLLWETEELL